MNSPNKLLICFFFQLWWLSLQLSFAKNITTKVAFNVGVILDLDEVVGKVRLKCMSMALADFYATHPFHKTRVVLHARNSNKDVIGAASAALDLLANVGAQAIIGPETSAEANIVGYLGNRSHVPVFPFSRTSPFVSSPGNPYFIETVQNDSSQVGAIIAIFKAFKWQKVIPVYEESDFEIHRISNLIDIIQENEIEVSYKCAILPSATDQQIIEDLRKVMKMQSKVFLVHATPSLGSRIFLKAQEVGMMSEGYAFIITDSMTNVLRSMNSSIIKAMQGVLGVKPYISKSKELENFKVRWKKEFTDRTHLSISELWAYDTVWALAMAVEKVGSFDYTFLKPNVTESSSSLATIGISKIGPNLIEAISNIRFKGLSGEFHIIDGQLQSSLFKVVNVIGKQGREIGIWSPEDGIKRDFNANKKNLGAVIWPGESTKVPKGWSFPPNGMKLRFGVPVVHGFDELLKVTTDPNTGSIYFTGYCVDLFNTVMKKLPYKVPYEFIPYDFTSFRSNDTSFSNYVYILDQVYHQNFDGVVGDTTITTNRSLYVDFTIPYTETGISMVMRRIKDNEKKDAWFFLKPLSREMWLATMALFVFTGCVIWTLEHHVNTNFRGSPSRQLGMIFWFSFSTIVFAHREKVTNNLTRFVLIIWVFVVLILTANYTASLTSTLTIQQFHASSDVNQLVKRGACIGYTSAVVKRLLNRLGISDGNLKKLHSLDEFDEALSRGSKRGGVSAIVEEIPYLRIFLYKHCDKYYMVGTISDTNGFGFVFRKGSPLVLEVSNALLEVKETQMMKNLESKWFNNVTDCADPSSSDSIPSLTVTDFRGLFLVTVIISICALLIFFGFFIHDHMGILTEETNSSSSSIGRKLVDLAKLFYIQESSNESETCQCIQKNEKENEEGASTVPLSTSEETATITQEEDRVSSEELSHPSPGSDATSISPIE